MLGRKEDVGKEMSGGVKISESVRTPLRSDSVGMLC
jgi:hypothetical protein